MAGGQASGRSEVGEKGGEEGAWRIHWRGEEVAMITNDLLQTAEGSESIDQTKSGSSILESMFENIAKSLTEDVSSYLIFVIFFTLTHFEAWKFYTQKCVNSRQNLLATKQRKLHTMCKITHYV